MNTIPMTIDINANNDLKYRDGLDIPSTTDPKKKDQPITENAGDSNLEVFTE